MRKGKRRGALPRLMAPAQDLWFGDDASFEQYRLATEKANGADPKFYYDPDDDEDEGGEGGGRFGGDYSYMLTKHGDVAVLQVYGSLVPKESWFNRYFGMVSYEEIRNAALAAQEGGAKALLMDFDTGGGAVSGIGELSDFLARLDREHLPVYSYTGSNMLSAGYWLGSMGRKVFGSKMALSGSIGVVSAHFSYARAMKEAGIDVTMFRQGEFKALGSPYEQLDDKAKADIEARMSKFYGMFLSHVTEQRGFSGEQLKASTEGRVFIGEDALKAGLVDEIMAFDDAISHLNAKHKDRPQQGAVVPKTTTMGADDMKRVLNDKGLAAVAAGMSAEDALKDATLSTEVAEDEGDGKEKGTAAQDGGNDGEGGDGAGTGQDTPKGEAKDGASAPGADAGLLDRLMDTTTKLAMAQAELKSLQDKETARAAHFTSLMNICGESINRMELPLNRSQSKFDGMSAEAIVNLYHSTLKDFNTQFKVGQTSRTPVSENLGASTTANHTALSKDLAAL